MNVCTFTGRLARDPQIRQTANGNTVCSITVATDSTYNKQKGEMDTCFVPCSCWGSTAEYIGKYAKKGTMVTVTGTLCQYTWYDTNDNKASRYDLSVTRAEIFFPKDAEQSEKMTPAPNPYDDPDDDPFAED